MKTVCIAVMTLITITASAQRGNDLRNNLTAEETTTLQVKKMTLALALDDSQAKRVHQVLLPQVKERKTQMKARKQAEEKARPSKEERFKKADEHLDKRIAVQRQLTDILTEDQFAKYQKMQAQRAKKTRNGARKKGNHSRHN